jgi:VWFA-related protein
MNLLRVLPAVLVASAIGVGAQAPPAPPPVFRIATDVVEVDVQVVDKTGRPITDLAAGDFTLLVDGNPRAITTVDLTSYRAEEAPPPAAASDPATLAVLASSYSSNAGTLPGRLFVLAIDQGNMTKGGGRGATEAVGRFLDKLTPADRVALVTLPAGPAVEFTSNHALVKAAAAKVVGGGANRYDGSYYRNLSLAEAFAFVTGSQRRLFNEAVSEECSFVRSAEEAARCRIDMENEARSKVMTAHAAEQATVNVLQALFERLAAVDGQKYVVFVGQALVTGASFGYLDGINDLAWIGAKAQAARVSLYVLQYGNAFLEAFDVSERRPSRTMAEDSRLLDDGMSAMAGLAGGAFFRLMLALDPAFDRIVRETSASYVLRFDVTQADRDGKSHDIQVKVNRPAVDVRARKSFAASGSEASTGRRLGLALKAPFVPHALTIDLATPVMREPGAGGGVRMLLAADIGCGPQAPLAVDVAVGLTTPDGRTRSLTPESASTVLTRGAEQCLYYATTVRLPEGDATVRLAAVSADGRSGAVDRLVSSVAAQGGGLRLGPVLLTDPATRVGGRMRFVVDGTVGDTVAAYVEAAALDAAAPPPGLHLLLEVAATATGPALLSDRPALAEDGAGKWYAETTLDLKALQPGQYVLRVVAHGNAGELTRTGRLLRVVGG